MAERKSSSITKLDSGIITNMPSSGVVLSQGRNVSFRPGCVYKISGKTLLATTNPVAPVRAMFVFRGYDNVWRNIVCCDTKIYSYTNNFTSVQDITPTPASGSSSMDTWTMGLIGGMPVISNGINTPWQWSNFANPMTALTNAPFCGSMHIHGNRIIVGNISEAGYSYPARLRWSDILHPTTWARDLALASGKKDLVNPNTSLEGQDRIQAITNLGARLVVFSLRNIWFGTPAEHPIIYSFNSLDQDIGMIAPKAYVRTPGGIYFMGQEEFYLLSGEGVKPIGFNIRDSCFPVLNKAAINTVFSYYKMSTREVVFCVPIGTATTPNTAFVYQEETGAWSIWDVDYLSHSQYWDSSNLTWDGITDPTWDSISTLRWDLWGTTGILPYEVCGNSTGQILKQDSGYNNNGAPIDAYIETGDISLDSSTINKIIYEVWLSLKPQTSINAIMVQVGTRDNLHQDISWSLPAAYTIGVSRNVSVRKQGKWIRLRFYSNVVDSPWILESADIKYDLAGTR